MSNVQSYFNITRNEVITLSQFWERVAHRSAERVGGRVRVEWLNADQKRDSPRTSIPSLRRN